MATFVWPTNTRRVTSNFRTASRPNHNGVDIAESGTRPIYAIAAGEVTRSYYSTSYGECIMIEHKVNGQTWESVYAHLRKGTRRVSVGQRVKKGQEIGTMGNTGHSYGQHLHFELHKGRWNSNKSNAVDPLKYLEKDLSPKKAKTSSKKKSISQMAQEVIDGKHGNGHENRRKSLGISKVEYEKVRAEVNRRLGSGRKQTTKPKKSISQMANEVIAGKHGNGHENRRKSLGISKTEYEKVRKEVNRRLK